MKFNYTSVFFSKIKHKIYTHYVKFYRIVIDPKYLSVEVKGLKKEWYGSEYGGFYLIPDLLNSKSIIYSFGVGEDLSFDYKINDKHKCEIFCFDPTPKSIEWFKKQEPRHGLTLLDYGISDKDEYVNFYLPKNKGHVSGSAERQNNVDENNRVVVQLRSLSSIMKDLNHEHIDVLKIDIEGSEYKVLKNIIDCNLSINQIVVEFHDRFFKNGIYQNKRIVKLLNQKGYKLFAASKSLEEISFVKHEVVGNRISNSSLQQVHDIQKH